MTTKVQEIFEKSERVETALRQISRETTDTGMQKTIQDFLATSGAMTLAKLHDLVRGYETKADAVRALHDAD
jgi:hypothetical protein